MRGWRRGAVLLVLLTTAGGCAIPAIGAQDYTTKTADTAKALVGVANSARLGATAWLEGKASDAYADTLVTNAEETCGSIRTTYGSRQPPDEASVALRERAGPQIQQTCDIISDLRIALRRGQHVQVRRTVDDLAERARALESLHEGLT